MESIEKSVEVDVPIYIRPITNGLSLKSFRASWRGVKEVRQTDDTHLHWKAEIGGKVKEWDAEITEQIPDQCIAWRATAGSRNDGMVTFQKLNNNRTKVTVHMDYDPEGFVENVGDALGVVSRRVQGDLERFKSFIESRNRETGAWRGEVHQST